MFIIKLIKKIKFTAQLSRLMAINHLKKIIDHIKTGVIDYTEPDGWWGGGWFLQRQVINRKCTPRAFDFKGNRVLPRGGKIFD